MKIFLEKKSFRLVSEDVYIQLEKYTRELFAFGSKKLSNKDLFLWIQNEFGMLNGKVILIDEIHITDFQDTFMQMDTLKDSKGNCSKTTLQRICERMVNGEWFSRKDGQKIPEMPNEFIKTVSNRYIELYEKFNKVISDDISAELKKCINLFK